MSACAACQRTDLLVPGLVRVRSVLDTEGVLLCQLAAVFEVVDALAEVAFAKLVPQQARAHDGYPLVARFLVPCLDERGRVVPVGARLARDARVLAVLDLGESEKTPPTTWRLPLAIISTALKIAR